MLVQDPTSILCELPNDNKTLTWSKQRYCLHLSDTHMNHYADRLPSAPETSLPRCCGLLYWTSRCEETASPTKLDEILLLNPHGSFIRG